MYPSRLTQEQTTTREPGLNRSYHSGERLRVGEGDDQRIKRRKLHPPASWRRLASGRQLDCIDVQIEQFTSELQSGLGDLLSVGMNADSDLEAERPRLVIHAHPHLRGPSVSPRR